MTRSVLVELCAGSAAVGLRARAGAYLRPPMAYVGSKRKIAGAILEAAGVQRIDRLVLVDPGPWGLVWSALTDPVRGREVVARIRGWTGEAPRELRPRLVRAWDEDQDVAAWLVAAEWSFRPGTIKSGAAWPEPMFRPTGEPCGIRRPPVAQIAEYVEAARALVEGQTAHHTTAQAYPIPTDARDHVVYLDPPYAGTIAYAHDFPRDEVVALAQAWAAAGALVLVSEACPLPIPGWHTVEIGSRAEAKGGGVRTFGRKEGQADWLTMSEPPRLSRGVQVGLFAEAAP